MYAETADGLTRLNVKPLSILMTDVIVEHNSQYFGNLTVNTVANSSQFLLARLGRLGRVAIKGTSSFSNSFIGNNGSVIEAFATDIYLTGNITFQERNISQLNINVTFDGNNAFRSGPATYAAPLEQCFQMRVRVFPHHQQTSMTRSSLLWAITLLLLLHRPLASVPVSMTPPTVVRNFRHVLSIQVTV